jgi:hypothetical protein
MVGLHTCRACYIGTPLYVCGFVVLGATFQKHLSVGALVMGWGIALVAMMVNTVAICMLLHFRLTLKYLTAIHLRCIYERLFPETPRRNQRVVKPRPCLRWLQHPILSSAMGNKARSVANSRL